MKIFPLRSHQERRISNPKSYNIGTDWLKDARKVHSPSSLTRLTKIHIRNLLLE
jgi:hypothetical protein